MLKLGSGTINKLMLGSTEIKKIYLGNAVIFQTGTPSAGWDLANVVYDSLSYDTSAQSAGLRGVCFKSDGTKMYTIESVNDRVYQYTLSTPWNVSTASYDSVSLSIGAQTGQPYGLHFNSTGSKLYILGDNNVFEYTLSSPWLISSGSYSTSYSFASQGTAIEGFYFKSDGSKMYCYGRTPKNVFQYSLSTPWNVSTASYDSVSFTPGLSGVSAGSLNFKSDGTRMYLANAVTNTFYQYLLASPWDLSFPSFEKSKSFSSYGSTQYQYCFKVDDGKKLYITSQTNTEVYQFSL